MANKTKEECDQIIKSGVCHFSIGEDFGKMIARIAMEHLEYDNDPVKALRTITESLTGCPVDMAVQILKGDIVLLVDVDTQEVMPMDRIAGVHDDFPKIDVMYYMQRMKRDICQSGEYIKTGLRALQRDIRMNYGKFNISIDYDSIFKFVAGNNEQLLEELRDDRDIHTIENLILTTKDYIAMTMKVQNTMNWMMKSWNDFSQTTNKDGNKNYLEYIQLKGDCSDMMLDVMQLFQETLDLNVSKFGAIENDSVEKYIESAIAIDKIVEKGIEPVNIMDNYSAGWLAPNGDYYALNGEIANMLHLQIADALLEKGIIPEEYKSEKYNYSANVDAWLEQAGWVKVHEDNIQFAGCLNNKVNKEMKNVDLTRKQIEVLYKYIQELHNGVTRLGWRQEKISAAKFQLMAENDIKVLNSKYFEF